MVKMSIFLKFMYRFYAIAIKISTRLLQYLHGKVQGIKLAKSILNKNKMGVITLLNFKTLYKHNNQDNVVWAEG